MQEEVVLEHYNKALRAIASKCFGESEDTLRQLIEKNIPELENNGGLPKSMSSLKYSCYVNLGDIYLKQNNTFKALEALSHVRFKYFNKIKCIIIRIIGIWIRFYWCNFMV